MSNVESMIWQDGWVPTTDHEVTQIMRYLSERKKESSRIVKSAQTEIAELEQIGKEAQDSYNRLENKIAALLSHYVMNEVDEDDRKETKTQIKYKLARGEIVVTKATQKIEKPTEADEVLLSATFPGFVKSEPKFQWGDFKKELELQEDGTVVHTPTGKTVSVPVVEAPQTTKVSLKL
ncbi:host-nuclease inhibitor Gam family protein [Paenibacillus sp. MMO-177]|uniref:host-nuclease inhibitor Gam family protein n=1 Tax=Paenibacillus sp. MMO-177 TaxID=3081289 RepID=UPI003019CC78